MSKLVVENLTKEYPTRNEPLQVLRGVSLEMSPGESLAIVGPSGSGKSTLLQIIGTLDQPTSGKVTLNGTSPFDLKPRKLSAFRRENIGFVFQDHHLLPQLTALENVLIPAIAGGTATDKQTERAKHLLSQAGLADRLDHRPAELSGGERQRTAIARALLLQPPLLLADEPTGNLDRKTSDEIAQLLRDGLDDENPIMLIVVTHSDNLAEQMQAKKRIEDGQLLA